MIPIKHQKDIKLLVDGKDAFPRLVKRILNAKRTIHINIFIWRDDKTGNMIAGELLKAADRGVKIIISKDRLGAVLEKSEENKQSLFHKPTSPVLWIKQKIVDFSYYNPGEPKSSRQKQNRLRRTFLQHRNIKVSKEKIKSDHSKYFIFDSRYLLTGGMNISNRHHTCDLGGRIWNDYMIEMKGEIFIKTLLSRLNGKKNNKDSWFDFIINSPNKGIYESKKTIIAELGKAKGQLIIQMAYFGDKDISQKIIDTANKGIETIIIIPKKANLQNDLNYKALKKIMLRTNSKVRLYACRNMMHAKMMLIDRKRLFLGSANFNSKMNGLGELDVLMTLNTTQQKKIMNSINRNIADSVRIKHAKNIDYNRIKAFLEGLVR